MWVGGEGKEGEERNGEISDKRREEGRKRRYEPLNERE